MAPAHAIQVENLGKRYQLGQFDPYRTLRETLAETGAAWKRRLWGQPAKRPEVNHRELWALKEISFRVGHGEVVGVIGHNGAGKSTLLKILSRITQPTTGRAVVRGRVGSLIEVGSGFHPELTGRENIYLNAAILGMRRAEINRRFDRIVDFSELEAFLDTPLKRYSSGMRVRLAFAVAVHLEPEVLFLDEIFAVGDASFRKKCLQRTQRLASDGRTVLIVSHEIANLAKLCDRMIVLSHGRMIADTSTAEATKLYYEQCGISRRPHSDRCSLAARAEAGF